MVVAFSKMVAIGRIINVPNSVHNVLDNILKIPALPQDVIGLLIIYVFQYQLFIYLKSTLCTNILASTTNTCRLFGCVNDPTNLSKYCIPFSNCSSITN